ncbi:MAG: RagB/SusD family nutrient uptake outer membrane protein [Pedobacter sp.]|nr:MAG: RagB/SusD family nutrient uptake outer membrane protein [Pedobacter sp.]
MNTKYKYSKNLLLLTLLLATLVSCKKSFLEILPKGRVIATKTTDYDLMLNNLDLVNMSANNHVLMGDEVVAIEPTWSLQIFKNKQAFKWEADLYNIEEDAAETLTPVKALYIYNKVIQEVLESTEGTEATKKSLHAEALAGRAWVNFMMVNFYGKPYNAATSGTDLGFPLILKADINGQDFKRATVQEMYDQIILDLNTAIPNLLNDGVAHRIRMSKAGAQGILAKVYMFMGRHSEALPLLNESLANVAKSTLGTGLVNYNTAWPGFPTVVNDVENVYVKNMTNIHISANTRLLYFTPATAALFKPSDTRVTRMQATATFPNGLVLSKRINTTTCNIGVRVPELYLLRAEVKARLEDINGAKADLELLRSNRMPAADVPVPATATTGKMPMLNYVLEERTRELALQGARWFDMRRLSVDPLFTMPVYQHNVYSAAGVVIETYTLKPERFVFRFAPKVRGENPNLIDNP